MTANKTLLSASKSKVAANKMAKSLGSDNLDRAIKNLQAAAEKLKKEEADQAARKRSANLKKLKSIMAKMGLSAADVRELSHPQARKRLGGSKKTGVKRKATANKGLKKGTKVAPKYQIKVGKQLHTWTGRGRMPLVFKNHIESGKALESCLITKSQ